MISLVAACLAAAAAAQVAGDAGAFVITKVDVAGNKYFKDDRVRDLLRVEKGERYERYLFDYMLEQGIAAVKDAYYAEGFHEARVRWGFRDVRGDKRKLQIQLDEGPRATVTDILLRGVSRERYLVIRENLGVEVGSPLSASLLRKAALAIGRYYGDRGYARARAELAIDRETGVVTFTVDEGRIYHVGEIIVTGNERTRGRIVTRELDYKLKPDRLYRASNIDEARAKVYRTGLYRDLKIETVDSRRSRDLVDILIIVREDKFKWYKVEPGYTSPDRASFTVGWGHNNVFGNNQQFSAEASAAYGFTTTESELGADLTYTEPWLFGYRYRGAATLYYSDERRRNYSLEEVGLEPSVTREITERLELSGGVKFKKTSLQVSAYPSDVFISAEPASDDILRRILAQAGRLDIGSIIWAVTYDGRDDVFNPLGGIYLYGSEETAGGFITGADFWRVVGDGRRYIRVGPAATFASHLRGGYARAYGDTKDVPFVERFFSGGPYSVRGYGERDVGPKDETGEPVGGNLFFTGNFELRFQLPFTAGRRVPGLGLNLGNLWGGLFADAGNVWTTWREIRKAELVYGAGIGLRYNTPVGPLRFDYGRPILEEGASGAGHFYFAFGHIF